MGSRIIALLGLLSSLVLVGSALAHGGGPGLAYDPCAQRIGDDYVHMTSYQPQLNWSQEYCHKIPAGGTTLFVFDLMGADLRQAPVSVRLIERGGATLVSIPFAQHISGVIHFSVSLQSRHSYEAIVTVGKTPTKYIVTFPLSVNSSWAAFKLPGLLALLILGGCISYGLRLRREHLLVMRRAEFRQRMRTVGGT